MIENFFIFSLLLINIHIFTIILYGEAEKLNYQHFSNNL